MPEPMPEPMPERRSALPSTSPSGSGRALDRAPGGAGLAAGPPAVDPALALMRRYAEGELQAFEELFAQHALAVYDFFLYMTHSREQALRLSEQAWLTVAKRRGELGEQTRFLPWLFGQAVQVRRERSPAEAADMAAAAKAPPVAVESAKSPESPESAEPAADAPLHRALAGMAESYREVLVLHRLSGLGFADIATALGATEAAVKARALQGYFQAAESALGRGDPAAAAPGGRAPLPLSRCPETEKLINLVVASPEARKTEPLAALVHHTHDCPLCEVTQKKVEAGYAALGRLVALARPETTALEQIARAVLPAVARDLAPPGNGWALALAALALLLLLVTTASFFLHKN